MITSAFLHWWFAHAPKGAVRSPHALLIVSLLRDAGHALTLRQLHAHMSGINYKSLSNLTEPLVRAGLLTEQRVTVVSEETARWHNKLITFERPRLCKQLAPSPSLNAALNHLAPLP